MGDPGGLVEPVGGEPLKVIGLPLAVEDEVGEETPDEGAVLERVARADDEAVGPVRAP